MLGAIGTGNIKKGMVTVSLGSSGTVYSYCEKPTVDPKGELALFCDATGHWLLLACTMNNGVAIENLRALFGWVLLLTVIAVVLSAVAPGVPFWVIWLCLIAPLALAALINWFARAGRRG